LHTDVLEDKYGNISAKVMRHDMKIQNRIRKMRENLNINSSSYQQIINTSNKKIQEIDKEIKEGEAIGKAFRKQGYSIRKNILEVYVIKIPLWLKKAFKTKSNFAKARISEFYAKKRTTEPVIYGVVVEIYSPDPFIYKLKHGSKLTASVDYYQTSKSDYLKSWYGVDTLNAVFTTLTYEFDY